MKFYRYYHEKGGGGGKGFSHVEGGAQLSFIYMKQNQTVHALLQLMLFTVTQHHV